MVQGPELVVIKENKISTLEFFDVSGYFKHHEQQASQNRSLIPETPIP